MSYETNLATEISFLRNDDFDGLKRILKKMVEFNDKKIAEVNEKIFDIIFDILTLKPK